MNTPVTSGAGQSHSSWNGLGPAAPGSCMVIVRQSRLSQIETSSPNSIFSRLTQSVISQRDQVLLGCTLLGSIVAIRSSDPALRRAGSASLAVASIAAGLATWVENRRSAALRSMDNTRPHFQTGDTLYNIQQQVQKAHQNISKHAGAIGTGATIVGVITVLIHRLQQCQTQQFRSCDGIYSGLTGMTVGMGMAALKVLHQHGFNLTFDKFLRSAETQYFPLCGFEIGMSKNDPVFAIVVTFINLLLYAFPQESDEASIDEQSSDEQSSDEQSTMSSRPGVDSSAPSPPSPIGFGQDIDTHDYPSDEETPSPANDDAGNDEHDYPSDEESVCVDNFVRHHPAPDHPAPDIRQ